MTAPNNVVTLTDTEVQNVPKDLFFEGMLLHVDIFVRLRHETYLLVGRAGEKANFSELHGFGHPNFKIFLRTGDHEKLISHAVDMTSKIVSKPNVSLKVKVQFVAGLASDAINSLENKKFSTAVHLKKISNLVIDMRQSSPLFDEVLAIVQDGSAKGGSHVMACCLTSLAIAEEMGVTQAIVLEKICMGALLHDVGVKFVPQEIMNKPRHQWTPAELLTYENHPLQGVEMLRDLKDLPMDVLLIISEHHENALGTGYPKRLRDVRISPLSRIVGLAVHFTDLLLSERCQSADEAMEYFEKILGQPFNKQVFSALKNIVNKCAMADQIRKS